MFLITLFFIVAFFAFVGGLFLIFHPKTLPSAIGMAVAMVSIGFLYLLLHFPFLTFVQIIHYAGAVMVMVGYLIMSQGFEEYGKEVSLSQTISSYIIAILFLFLCSKAVSQSFLSKFEKTYDDFGSIREIGISLIRNWGVPFEILSVILVVAMVGSVILAKRSLK